MTRMEKDAKMVKPDVKIAWEDPMLVKHNVKMVKGDTRMSKEIPSYMVSRGWNDINKGVGDWPYVSMERMIKKMMDAVK